MVPTLCQAQPQESFVLRQKDQYFYRVIPHCGFVNKVMSQSLSTLFGSNLLEQGMIRL